MRVRLIFILLFLVQLKALHCQVALMVYNRSGSNIDSVVVDGTGLTNFGKIEQSSGRSFFVSSGLADFHSFSPFYLRVYVKGQEFSKQWMRNGFVDSFYFFDHGLNDVDTPLPRPETFELLIFNAMQNSIETIRDLNSAIVEIKDLSPRRRKVFFDRSRTDSTNAVVIQLNDTVLVRELSFFNFDDWNYSLASFYIEGDSVFSGVRSNRPRLEYIVDLHLEGVAMEDVQVQSESLVAEYNEQGNFGDLVKRLVFDYEKLRSESRFTIIVGKKKHLITIRGKDFDDEVRSYFVSKKRVR